MSWRSLVALGYRAEMDRTKIVKTVEEAIARLAEAKGGEDGADALEARLSEIMQSKPISPDEIEGWSRAIEANWRKRDSAEAEAARLLRELASLLAGSSGPSLLPDGEVGQPW